MKNENPVRSFLPRTSKEPASAFRPAAALWLVIAFITVHSAIAVAADPSTGPYYGFQGTAGKTLATSTPWWPTPTAQGTAPVPKPPVSHSAPADAPNIVVVLADDLGYSDLGSFGSEIPTPSLDKLANNGLRFRNYTTHSLCSPTRAALLTGLNGHSAGVGFIADGNPGFPGYAGQIQQNAVTLAEVLRDNGYTTIATGKWHLTQTANRVKDGPYDSWPLQRGFDNYYGFLDGETHPQHPHVLYEGNQRVTVDKFPHDFSTSDLWTSKAIDYVKAAKKANPNKPFFLYLADNAVHAPLNPRADLLQKVKGKYAAGWDAIRAARFQKQKDLGLIPANTVLPPLNPGVVAWNTLSDSDKALYARYEEAYAAWVSTLDRNFGRLYSYLESSGQLNNTIIVFASDNGGSQEGGLQGTTISLQTLFGGATNKAFDETRFDLIGGEQTSPHYPLGWSTVSNTPFRGYKQNTTGGGRRVPLIVSWPGHITDKGAIRTQLAHVTDITPTLLELTGITHPDTFNGVPTKPLEGTSLAYLLNAANANAAEQHTQQYYELAGNRGYYKDGWYIVTQHTPNTAFSDSEWQLYNLNDDFSETNNLAATNTAKVAELSVAFDTAAQRYQVYPMFQGSVSIVTAQQAPYLYNRIVPKTFANGDWAEQPDITPLLNPYWNPFGNANGIHTSGDYSIQATVHYAAGNQGIIFANGADDLGSILYIENGELAFENVGFGTWTKFPRVPLQPGILNIQFNLKAAAYNPANGLNTGAGSGSLYVNGTLVSQGNLPVWSANTPSLLGEPLDGLDIGKDRRGPVSWDIFNKYGVFKYSGVIDQVTVTPVQLPN
jgi:arylsulfatase A-like enzyme